MEWRALVQCQGHVTAPLFHGWLCRAPKEGAGPGICPRPPAAWRAAAGTGSSRRATDEAVCRLPPLRMTVRVALFAVSIALALLGACSAPGAAAVIQSLRWPKGAPRRLPAVLRLRPQPMRGGEESASQQQPTAAWADEEASDETLAAGAMLMGCNGAGQLGHDDKRPRASMAFQGRSVKLLAFGARHTIAVVADGTEERVLTLGDNGSGQLGRPNAAEDAAVGTPDWAAVRLSGAGGRRAWRQVACGNAHTALLDADGALVVFGSNALGQLGLGNRQDVWDAFNATDMRSPVHWQQERRLRAPLERSPGPVAQVACGGEHTVLLLASGQVLSFGSNTHGQLGRHFDSLWAAREDTPLRVPVPSNERVVQVACGDQHTVMLLSNGTALAFGSNALGQLGTGRDPLDTQAFAIVQFAMVQQGLDELQQRLATCFSNTSGAEPNQDAEAQRDKLLKLRPGIRPQPTRVLVPAGERVTSIACGAYHTALCCQSGRVYMCGRNSNGQLGLGHCNDTDTPQLVTALDPFLAHHDDSASSQLADAVSEADSADEECGVRKRLGPVGTLIVLDGDGTVNCEESTHGARRAGGGGRGVVHAACGDAHTLFVCREGSVWACGCNAQGQLGVRQALQVRERKGQRGRERAREGEEREREGEREGWREGERE